MALYYETKQETITGADCTGSDGDSNRTYSLSNTGAVAAGMQIYVAGIGLQYGHHYTMSVDVITFLTPIFDIDNLTIDYDVVSSTVTATGTGYTTAALVQAELRASTAFGSTTNPSIDTINNWIDEESRVIDELTGQVFSSKLASSIYIDYDGEGRLRFPNVPLISITSVEYNTKSLGQVPSWVTFEEGEDKDYISYLDLGEIEFVYGVNRSNQYTPTAGNKKFRLTYNYGYSSVPADVQKLATLLVSRRTLMSLINSQSNSEGGEIQIGPIRITDPSSYGINYYVQLNTEIDRLLAQIGRKFRVYRPTRVYM